VGDPDPKLLAYQYLQMLPQIAQGDSNKLWIVPSELGEALKGLGGMLGAAQQAASPQPTQPPQDGPAQRAGHQDGAPQVAARRVDPQQAVTPGVESPGPAEPQS
jgi:hypothetical protein